MKNILQPTPVDAKLWRCCRLGFRVQGFGFRRVWGLGCRSVLFATLGVQRSSAPTSEMVS